MRNGGKVLVDQLLLRGTDQVFCVPGESYLEVLNALYDVTHRVKVYNARHEAGAANMAEAYGKLTGNPGVALVTRGPGACHASVGVHIAYQDSTPMILIIGQVSQATRDREAFQEIDYQAMFGSVSKWCAQIDSVDRIPEYMSKAYSLAVSGRPGPVVLSIPENVLSQNTDIKDGHFVRSFGPAPEKNVMQVFQKLLDQSSRPMLLLGGSGWSKKASKNVLSFALQHSVPIVTGFRRQDLIDNNSQVFCGALGTSVSPNLLERIKEVDLLIVIGSRLGEMTTQGYKIFDSSEANQKMVHVQVDAKELGSVYPPTLGIVSSVVNFSEVLHSLELKQDTVRMGWVRMLNSEYLEDIIPPPYSGKLDLGKVLNYLNQAMPDDAIITLDAGNHTGWPQRFLKHSPKRRQIGPTCGAMGYSVPAAVASSLVFADKLVVCFVGDGGFMMSGLELMTAVQYSAKVIIIVFNNNSYGTIRMHQEKEHPGRVIATALQNPSFRDLATAMGAHAELVENTDSFIPAFERCLLQKNSCLIELKTDTDQLSSRFSINKK
jgi:acetolactate synthase-1/2/3 large subunit